jgi:hypothetical protein
VLSVLIRWLPFLLFCASAHAAPDIIDRDQWHARAPRADISTYAEYGLDRPAYTRIVLHVTSKGYGAGVEEMKRIQDFHMDMRGFSDIGYNYLIDSEGSIYEGRSLDFVPSHAGRSIEGDEQHNIRLDPDYQSIGVVFSVDPDQPLTGAQESAVIQLIEYLQDRHPVKQVITHTEIRSLLESRGLTPQQPFDPAVCPGPGSIEQVVRIREAFDPLFDEAAYRLLFGALPPR